MAVDIDKQLALIEFCTCSETAAAKKIFLKSQLMRGGLNLNLETHVLWTDTGWCGRLPLPGSIGLQVFPWAPIAPNTTYIFDD